MDLPVRLQHSPGTERVLSVDGAFGAPGLNLSHWPGNTTPAELAHELSTGSALAFARLPAARRAELARGCVALVNNHVDTDGICASFCVLHPEAALPRADRLLAAAEAGDYFRVPDEGAFVLDCILGGLLDAERSPLRARFAGLTDAERHLLGWQTALEILPALLDGDVEDYAGLWHPALAALRADRADLARARRDELVHLDLAVFTAPGGLASSREGAGSAFDPGRHALFATTRADRVLVIGPGAEGTTYRLVVNTTSWFDRPGVECLPRPDLEALAARLDRREGVLPGAPWAWRAQAPQGAAPELWFGHAELESFAESNPALAPSRLAPEVVTRELLDALREVWVFPG